MRQFVNIMRQVRTSPVLAVAILALVGALVLFSAPQPTPPITQAKMGVVGSSATATPIPPTATTQPTSIPPTATPVPPTPTATIPPTATPVPPTPIPPTPTPSWHIVGTYSGTGPGPVVTLTGITNNDPNNVRIDYTCQAPSGMWRIGFQVVSTTDDGAGDGVGTGCGGTYPLSGSYLLTAYPNAGGPDWQVSMSDATDAGGPWTATVSIRY